MAHSRVERIEATCPHCDQLFTPEVWTIVDVWERPDLALLLQRGILHLVTCPSCGARVAVDTPLLVYRVYKDSPILFSMPDATEPDKATQYGLALLAQLRETLGNGFDPAWLHEQYEPVDRDELRVLLNIDLVLIGRGLVMASEADNALAQGTAPERLQGLWQLIAAKTWSDAARVIGSFPVLLEPDMIDTIEELIRAAKLDNDADTVELLTEHRDLLIRCQQVGVAPATAEMEAQA